MKIVFSLPGLCCFRTCIPYRTSDKKWRPKFEIYQDIMSTKGLSGGFTACKAWRLWHLFLPTYPAKLDSNFCVLGRGTRIALNLMFLLDCFASFFFLLFSDPQKKFFTRSLLCWFETETVLCRHAYPSSLNADKEDVAVHQFYSDRLLHIFKLASRSPLLKPSSADSAMTAVAKTRAKDMISTVEGLADVLCEWQQAVHTQLNQKNGEKSIARLSTVRFV